VAMRRRFSHFGPKKILKRLRDESPEADLPAASTIGEVLKRAGLVQTTRRQRRPIAQGHARALEPELNGEWSVDFKGWFRTRSGLRIDPLTVTDNASRYILAIDIVRPTHEGVRPVFARLFGDFGLPLAMRSDNGAPFGSNGAGGLSRLSVWLLKLGVEPHFGRPASPQDNGRHERMHRTLKAQTTRPAAADAAQQQRRFDRFRDHFNDERPHEALDQATPGQSWRPSPRPMPAKIEAPWYDADHEVRRVRATGEVRWRGRYIFIGEALAGEDVGLAERDEGRHVVRFCHHDLGVIDANFVFRRFAPKRTLRGETAETKQE
jgi:putative transposase